MTLPSTHSPATAWRGRDGSPLVPSRLPLPRAMAYAVAGLEAGQHAGVQLYASLRGATLVDAACGIARAGHSMSCDTLVPWLSAGKPLLAMALGRLWEKAALDIDDLVAMYVPEFGRGGKDIVTLRHLLTHTSAIPIVDLEWAGSTWEDVIGRISDLGLAEGTSPGQRAAYDPQAGWYMLAEVIRRIHRRLRGGAWQIDLFEEGDMQSRADAGDGTQEEPAHNQLDAGREFARLMVEEVFAPLGMADSWMGLPLDRQKAYSSRMATLFLSARSPGEAPTPADWDTPQRAAAISPGGSARGPIRELGRFYECLLAKGAMRDGKAARESNGAPPATPALAQVEKSARGSLAPRLLAAPTVEALTSRARVGMVDETFRQKVDWGLGFLVNSNRYGPLAAPYGYGAHASERAFGHGGMQSTTAYADPANELVVACFFNGLPGEARHSKRAREFNTLLYEDLSLGA